MQYRPSGTGVGWSKDDCSRKGMVSHYWWVVASGCYKGFSIMMWTGLHTWGSTISEKVGVYCCCRGMVGKVVTCGVFSEMIASLSREWRPRSVVVDCCIDGLVVWWEGWCKKFVWMWLVEVFEGVAGGCAWVERLGERGMFDWSFWRSWDNSALAALALAILARRRVIFDEISHHLGDILYRLNKSY